MVLQNLNETKLFNLKIMHCIAYHHLLSSLLAKITLHFVVAIINKNNKKLKI